MAPTFRPRRVPGSLPGTVWTNSPWNSGSSLSWRNWLDQVVARLSRPLPRGGLRKPAKRASVTIARSRLSARSGDGSSAASQARARRAYDQRATANPAKSSSFFTRTPAGRPPDRSV